MTPEREARFMVTDDDIEIVAKSPVSLHLSVEQIQDAQARVAAGEDPDVVAFELAIEEVALQSKMDNP